MRRMLTPALMLLAAAPVLGDSPKDRWIGDFNTAMTEAKKSSKPIFLVFR